MRIYIDLDSLDVIEAPSIRQPLERIWAKRGTSKSLQVQFVRSGEPELLPPGSQIRFGPKAQGEFDGDFIVFTDAFTAPGDVTGFYEASANFNTTDLNTLLGSPDGTTANDEEEVELMAEFSWLIPLAANPEKSKTIIVEIDNAVDNGDESAPSEAGPALNTRLTALEQLGSIVLIRADGTGEMFAAAGDSDAQRGTALLAVRTAAVAGDTIRVGTGGYYITTGLAKDGVNWRFEPGSLVVMESDTAAGIWDDGGAAMTFVVSGAGSFHRYSATAAGVEFKVIDCSHVNSDIAIQAHSILAEPDPAIAGASIAINCDAGILRVEANRIAATGVNDYATWWHNGSMTVRAHRITGGYVSAGSAVDTTPTGDGHVWAEELEGLVYTAGTNSAAAFWVRANTIRGVAGAAQVVYGGGNERLYVEAQKIFGLVSCQAGLLYVRTDKISAKQNGTSGAPGLIYVNGGTARITATHLDPVTFTGEMLRVNSGALELRSGAYVGIASALGLTVTGGTSRLMGMRLDTVANSATNPVTKSGGTLILDHSTLVAEGTRDSIAAATAQTVISLGSYANKAVDADVTIDGLLTVGAYVV
jgi:hypothetical protein